MTQISKENIYSIIKSNAVKFPSKSLVVVDNEEIAYEQFINDVNKVSNALRSMGVVPGQTVAILMPNSIKWYVLFWAIVKIGARPVPLDPQIGEWEMVRLMTLTDIQTCFVATSYRSNKIIENLQKARHSIPDLKTIICVDPKDRSEGIMSFESFLKFSELNNSGYVHQPNENDLLMLACTSGSTGNPKVIAVPHIGFYQSQLDMGKYLGFNDSDIMLLGMPLYHQGGFGMGLQMVLNGGTVMYQSLFEPAAFLKFVSEKRITVIQLTATLAKILISVPDFDKYDLSCVRISYFAGEVLPVEIAKVFYEKLNIRVINIIGSSESGTMVVWDSKYDRHVDPSDFQPLPFTKMRILDEAENEVECGEIGSIFIHTDALITEYYKNEEETTKKLRYFDGLRWFNTGDLGKKLPDGRVRFTGRAKRVIKRGSNLVIPEEIEAFLLTHSEIEAIAVMGQKHELLGEMIIAHIQPKKSCEITRGKILKFCQGKLSAYKVPDQVVITDEIPRDIGKVQFKYLKGASNV